MDKGGYLFAGTRGGKIYRSTNDGATWITVYQSSVPNSIISSITEDEYGYIYAANTYEGILRSTNRGSSWQKVKIDLLSQFRFPIGANKEGVYASGSGDKCFFSSDQGNTWIDITSNLELTRIQEISFDKNERVYFATDESIWRINPDSTTAVSDHRISFSDFQLNQNYPNPFNPSTKISYTLKDEGYVKLLIYDIKGELLSTLVNEKQQQGSYEVDFTLPGNISTGVYIYRLTVADNGSHNVFFLM
jgi:hypothetical protein